MGRIARVVAPVHPHHPSSQHFAATGITQRGNLRQQTFLGEDDYRAYLALAEGEWLTDRTAGWVCTWRQYLRRREEEDLSATLQRHERTGRPLGDKSFVEKLSRLLDRDLLPGKPGRPKKDDK